MMELCCSRSIGERIYRAQLLLCPKLCVSPILHPTNSAPIPENQALARLILAPHISEPYQTGPRARLSLPGIWAIPQCYQHHCCRRQGLSGQRALLQKEVGCENPRVLDGCIDGNSDLLSKRWLASEGRRRRRKASYVLQRHCLYSPKKLPGVPPARGRRPHVATYL